MTMDEVRQLLTQPEGSTLEFKQRWTRDTPREIVALANGRGGTIILGVSNALPRQIIGLEESFDEVEGMILNSLRDRVQPIMHPLPQIDSVFIDDKYVLVILVPESQIKPLAINGQRIVRRGSHTETATREEERRMFQESREVSFEHSLIPNARYEHLAARKIESYLQARISRAETRPPQELLVSLGLVREGDYAPTVAAMVLFGEYPPRFLPQCALNAVRVRGLSLDTNIFVDRELIEGTAAELIERAVQFVTRNMRVGGVIGAVFRQDIPEYPETAVREAVINAVIHRDYSIQQMILLRMFDDRLEIENAGGLPSGVTLEMLLQNPRPYPRNPLMVRTLYEFWQGLGLIEALGGGIPRIRRALRELGAGDPVFWADSMSFRVTVPAKSLDQPREEE